MRFRSVADEAGQFSFFFFFFFFLVGGKGGNVSCTLAPRAPCVGLQYGLPMGLFCPLDNLPSDLPTKTLLCRWSRPHPCYVKSTVGPCVWSKLANCLSAHRVLSFHCRIFLALLSMNLVVFQLFLTRSVMLFLRVSAVSFGDISWSLIELLFLDFHMAHTVSVIRMCSLSESLFGSFSNPKAGIPLISPRDVFGQFLVVVFHHIFLAVSHVISWPLCSHSSHKCCSVSIVSMPSFLMQEHRALPSCLGMLFQKVPHLILPVSMHLMWSFILGGIPRALIPFRSLSLVGLNPVASSTSGNLGFEPKIWPTSEWPDVIKYVPGAKKIWVGE